MSESTLAATIAAVGTVASAVVAAALPLLMRRVRKTSPPEASSPRRVGFFQILSFGLSITAIVVTLITQRQLASLQQTFRRPPGELRLAKKFNGSPDDGSVTVTVPPGTYMTGITFGLNKGSSHGIVNSVTPLYRPFLSSSEDKQP